MRPRLTRLALLLCCFLLEGTSPADVCSDLRATKTATYGFRPTKLSKGERDKKNSAMDGFWKQATKTPAASAPCLRAMISQEQQDVFFLFDAAQLLLTLDQSRDSLASVQDGLLRTDLEEADLAAYLYWSQRLALTGTDIGPIGLKYLRCKKPDAYIVQHALKVDRSLGALFLFGAMDPKVGDKYLVTALSTSEPPEVRYAAAFALTTLLTEESFKALHQLDTHDFPPALQARVRDVLTWKKVEPSKSPEFTREQIIARLRQLPDLGTAASEAEGRSLDEATLALLKPEDIGELYAARSRSMRLSDEALYDYFDLTKLILGLINRHDLYREYRSHS